MDNKLSKYIRYRAIDQCINETGTASIPRLIDAVRNSLENENLDESILLNDIEKMKEDHQKMVSDHEMIRQAHQEMREEHERIREEIMGES